MQSKVCVTQKGTCNREGVIYELQCEECTSKYIGESARNAYTRVQEHEQDIKNKSKDSVMLRHKNEKHPESATPSFTAKVINSYGDNALYRQIAESVYIEQINPEDRINIKTEWNNNYARIPRLTLDLGTWLQ